MGLKAIDMLRHIDFANMSDAERAVLLKKFQAHREQLMKNIHALDKAIASLKKPKGKPSPKRKAPAGVPE
jgi:hypothetical protein